jgi:hypothetical protein
MANRRAHYYVDEFGRMTDAARLGDMLDPMRCMRCRQVFDGGHVEVVARYTDCDVFKCPKCGATVDNRPVGWGGSVERLDPATGRAR